MTQRLQGYTLIEIMISLMLVAIFCAGSIFGMRYWQMHTQMVVQVTALKHAILTCQEQARSQQVQVVFCGSAHGKVCDGRWSKGWLAYQDNQHHSSMIFYHKVRSNQVQWSFKSSLGKNDRLIFNPQGDNLGQQGSFYFCPEYYQKTFMRRIVVNQLGRVYSRNSSICEGV